MAGEHMHLIAGLANVSAVLKEAFHWWWVGFYLVKDKQLVLGPFQGPVACTRIAFGKGVCGAAWAQNETLVVKDVHQFPGHIACSAESNTSNSNTLNSNNFQGFNFHSLIFDFVMLMLCYQVRCVFQLLVTFSYNTLNL